MFAMIMLGAMVGQDPALIPGRQCAAFILESVALRAPGGGGRVASPDRPVAGEEVDRDADARPISLSVSLGGNTNRPTERVASDRGAPLGDVLGLAPIMDQGSMASLPDGWIPVGGGPVLVPTSNIGNIQYYDVRNYVVACEAMATVTPLPAPPPQEK